MSEMLLFDLLQGSHGNIGKITLNNPKSLNALNTEMIDAFQSALDQCEADETIKAVFVEGAGERAFCAGGDVVGLYNSMKETDKGDVPQKALEFFTKEYRLDYRLHTFSKPIISWGHGIVMGGGIGVMSACSHRIVTEKSMLAMPEVTIGLYPDVGASWFFNRMPANIGKFLGMTGSRINAADAIYAKLADTFILEEYREDVLQDLMDTEWSENLYCDVSNALQESVDFSKDDMQESQLQIHYSQIQYLLRDCDLKKNIERMSAFEAQSDWLKLAQKSFNKGCPVTYMLVDEQIKRSRHMSLKQVFEMELIMSVRCAMNPDLEEGIRALLIDKDGQPQWSIGSVSEINKQEIQQFFTPPEAGVNQLFNK